MAVKPCPLKINEDQHEIDVRGTPILPCAGYLTEVNNIINIPWHWHEEIEVLILSSGKLKVDFTERSIIIDEGEGLFLNLNTLHSITSLCEQGSVIKSLVFKSSAIANGPESMFEQKFINPIRCSKISYIHFNHQELWHKRAIQCIAQAYEKYENRSFGFELLVKENLLHLWYLIISNNQNEIMNQNQNTDTENKRLKEMLKFIHENYSSPIVLEKVAKTANISTRECLRCFKKVLGTTPIKYLLKYRISKASEILLNTDLNITDICGKVGFESPSHFSLMFKRETGVTPKEYRKEMKTEYHC